MLSKGIQLTPLSRRSYARTVRSCEAPQMSIDVACNLLQLVLMGMS